MPQASVKRIINCNKKDLIELVLDIEKYPNFIPYCLGSKVYSKEDKSEAEEPMSQSKGGSRKEKLAQKRVERVSVIRGYGRVCLSGSPTKK